MTTTLWIVVMIAVAVIGAWVGYYEGYKSGHEGGVSVAKGNTLFDGIERIVESVNNDPMQCVSVCSKRRTPNEDIKTKLRKIACKFTDEENARKVENEQYVGESDMCIKPDFTSPVGYDPSKESIRFIDGELRTVIIEGVEQSNIEAAESAKVNDAPDCEGDDCRLTFCGGDGIE